MLALPKKLPERVCPSVTLRCLTFLFALGKKVGVCVSETWRMKILEICLDLSLNFKARSLLLGYFDLTDCLVTLSCMKYNLEENCLLKERGKQWVDRGVCFQGLLRGGCRNTWGGSIVQKQTSTCANTCICCKPLAPPHKTKLK